MRYTFRIKLMAILGTAALAFVVLLVVTAVFEQRSAQQLALIAERHIPRLELGPKLSGQFEHLRRNLQDAVLARDPEALRETVELKKRFLATLADASRVMPAEKVELLQDAFLAYYATAYDVAERVLRGDTNEQLVDSVATMQQQQRRAVGLLERVTAFDQSRLSDGFAVAAGAQATATRVRVIVSVSSLVLVLLLSLWLSRSVLRSLSELGAGFHRFGQGDFTTPIHVTVQDEFAELARRANQMAENLRRLGEERDLSDWLKEGHAGLTLELRGGLEPAEAADRACRFLARYLEAPAAALYWGEGDGTFGLLGHYASWSDGSDATVLSRFRAGEGLIGQSTREQGITIVTDLPPDYLPVRSGLGAARPHALALLPLVYLETVVGVLELALFKPCSKSASELLLSVRETLAVVIEVARGRAALRLLLLETQRQASRLLTQEDALRSKNEELETQQEELRRANSELTEQAAELEFQRTSLQRSNDELRETRRILEQKAHELSKVSAYKSQFLANMSHELRTPLNSMLLLSSLLADNREQNLTDKQVEFCKTMHGSGQDLLALINQILDLAKVESGKQEVRLGRVKLHELASYARRVFEPLARDKELEFNVDIDSAALPETIVTDGKRVEQILNNLLGNAIKFTTHGAVSLTLGKPEPSSLGRGTLHADDTLAISVSDTGAGIPPEHQARIFAPFEQLDASPDRRYGGTGLGLSIARELATLLGGELRLSSVVGQGSTFVCHLPYVLTSGAPDASSNASMERPGELVTSERTLCLPPAERQAEPLAEPDTASDPELSTQAPDAQVRLEGRKILIADGDMRTVYALSALLRARGAEVRVADTGRAALDVLADDPDVELVLMDIVMPEMDGFEAIRSLRREPRLRDLPVIALTAKTMRIDREQCVRAGATDYLAKPIEPELLLGMLRTCLASGEHPHAE